MGEAPAPFPIAQSAPGTMMAEGLRQRQLDRLALRGSPTKALRATTSAEDVKNVTSFPAQPFARSDVTMPGTGDMAKESSKINRHNDDAFETQNSPIRSNGSFGEVKRDVSAENANAVIGGKQFTISKVGNNGRIYLRPRIRPAHQRYPQPPFAFPNSSPNTAGLDEAHARKERRGSYRDTMLSADSSMSTPANPGLYDTNSTPAQSSTNRHRRTHSYSTVDDQRSAIQDSDLGAFKVVIERPSADGRRPKTSGGHHRTPTLEVPIPSYKLGTPRFSNRGTPFMRGSSYAGTEVEHRSSFMSQRDTDMLARMRRSNLPRSSHSMRQSVVSHPGDVESTYELRLPPTGLLRTSPNIMPKGQIVPEMYDALTYPPRCEDRSVIRRMSETDMITAATPARLVAEVTQELSYELVASFFITYRSYISGSDLLLLVMARLEWGIDRAFDGLVVTVRCFTVIRHWLVNFFADDFVLDYDLRVQFCGLVNTMVKKQALLRTDSKTTNDILSNIKRLWRDSCAVYWDGPEFACDLDALVPIAPGGIAGSRNPQLTPKFWDDLLLSQTPGQDFEDPTLSKSPMVDLDLLHDFPAAPSANRFFATAPPEFPIEFNKAQLQQASLPRGNRTQLPYPEPLSPRSITSVEALSCSIPPLSSKTGQFSAGAAMGAHPVTAASQSDSTLPVAHTPKALRPKSYRPGQGFQRHRSVSNSSRPDRNLEADAEEAANGEAGLTLVDRFAGSLVRGLVFPPGHVYLPTAEHSENRPISLPNKKTGAQKQDTNQQGLGMKRMFGTVRRAVSTRADNKPEPIPTSPLTLGFPGLSLPVDDIELASLGLGGMATEQSPLQPPPKPVTMRPDILSKFVESDFGKAIEQHKINAAKANESPEPWVRRINVTAGSDFLRRSLDKATITACSTSLSGLVPGHLDSPQPRENTSFLLPDNEDAEQTQNNTSFLLDDGNDGYVDRDIAMMSGALPSHPSTDAFTDSFNNRSVAPTPPVTPPEIFLGSPRRSSHILGNYGRPSPTAQVPSLTLDMLSPSSDFDTRPFFRPLNNPSMHSRAKRHKHRRSTSLRRIASFHSGYTNQMTERSFDATSISDSVDRASVGSTHAPGNRVLRRRPGGDLRAVQNIGELPLRRHRSSGSLTTYSDSIRSSYLLGGGSTSYADVRGENDRAQSNPRIFSVGALADPEGTSKPRISLLSTSSKPALRPSFQAEAAKLAQIPDDTDDDGGVEAALLKLEGRYEKRKSDISSQSLSPEFIPPPRQETYDNDDQTTGELIIEAEKHQHKHNHVVEEAIFDNDGASEVDQPGQRSCFNSQYELQPTVYRPPVREVPDISRESQNSIPLLQRDGSRYGSDDDESRNWRNTSVLLGPSHDRETVDHHGAEKSETLVDFVNKTESSNQIPAGGTLPRQMSVNESFLQIGDDNDANNYDDYDDNHSDLSSEMSLEEVPTNDFLGNPSSNTHPPIHPGAIITEVEIPPISKQTKEPSMTMEQALLMSPTGGQYQGLFPPSPDITPTYGEGGKDIAMRSWYSDDHLETQQRQNINGAISTGPLYSEEHMPFILHFDPKIVAEQFTLIEKEALGEIHFRELLEMKWSHEAASACQSWPKFLQILQQMEEDDTVSHGIEICGARSSIMTQWAISQIILTQDINERARTIAKLIEIAVHCRQLGNYATLFQLTVAVSNPVIAELHETWKHVPAAEVQSLREFEELIQPANNFRRLRDEMESVLGKRACLPLVVIYAKDLTVLKDMPSYIASTPTDPPLINVSKCRAQATVVQLFSRYLESSTGYKFQTVPGLTDRCLWIAGLSPTEIRSRAERLV
ncbi:mitotic regulator [Pseudogymnoascus verrucosus]|uniref:Mitotic regulator n=1 Tax=Pseudogymnoascus verrucosus TaxID=342668 RepID=A0A1B8GH34_9PEZI|nr:mitotic regulator [Pseudogymnoascus verrucosus]OBT95120.1 mitotic regulator [Pseudogymnoascus verrucosus]